MTPSPLQLLIVGAIILLLFGASRFADLGKGLGEGIRNFKKGVSEDADSSDGEVAKASGDSKTDADASQSAASAKDS